MFRKLCIRGGREKLLCWRKKTGDCVKLILKERNHEADHLANLGVKEMKKVPVEEGDDNERCKAVR